MREAWLVPHALARIAQRDELDPLSTIDWATRPVTLRHKRRTRDCQPFINEWEERLRADDCGPARN